jgi:hypothetical protein
MRRGDQERIHEAHRAGMFARLTQNERIDDLDAEHWISRWEREAESKGLARTTVGFWTTGWDWIAEQRGSARSDDATKTDMSADGDYGQVYGGQRSSTARPAVEESAWIANLNRARVDSKLANGGIR